MLTQIPLWILAPLTAVIGCVGIYAPVDKFKTFSWPFRILMGSLVICLVLYTLVSEYTCVWGFVLAAGEGTAPSLAVLQRGFGYTMSGVASCFYPVGLLSVMIFGLARKQKWAWVLCLTLSFLSWFAFAIYFLIGREAAYKIIAPDIISFFDMGFVMPELFISTLTIVVLLTKNVRKYFGILNEKKT